MKRLSFSVLLVLLAGVLNLAAAQSKKSSGGGSGYQNGLGLRAGGYSSGATFKHFISGKNNVALEALLTTEYRAKGARLTVLLEKHLQVADLKGLQFYYGAGAHAGAYKGRYYYVERLYYYNKGKYRGDYYVYVNDDRSYVVFGADLILGLEYKMPDLPFVVGVDYKPYFEVFDGYTGLYNDAAVSLRFTF
ncbi:hypothetical protein [Hymenobacter yonginensis]|uniref:Outer membrane protein beta-barrel domain-containing protein n=1 Tax=Hymenobacter yonginensis TaxID=748197 RepID=A0ABY7PQB2_9BACT|nr:hypothetical protein [Hymenobacter yonginensis]WBO84820.1 hypothetical protein O9Z63_00935 [Hymenobacter yonginensis]